MNQGQELRFCGGKYHGKTGWKNDAAKPTPAGKVPVIVNEGKNSVKVTYVERQNIRKPWAAAATHEEAAMQQYKDVEGNMIKSAMLWAKMGPKINDGAIVKMFEEELTAAKIVVKKKKAYKYVEFPYDNKKRAREDENDMQLDEWGW